MNPWLRLDTTEARCSHLRHARFVVGVFCLLTFFSLAALGDVPPKFHSVLVSADVTDGERILLSWPPDPDATSYAISRKLADGTSWTLLETFAGHATQFVDSSVELGWVYEYQIIKTAAEYTGYGLIRAGIEAPLAENRGKIVLIVANTHATDLAPELGRLQQDLVGDGWNVLRHDVAPGESPQAVKALILADYAADPVNVRSVFLFGSVAVPYSGLISPDGHTNHMGAWPADVYYADMHGLWTDSSVTSTNAERTRNWNVPGDGRFDQNSPPGGATLQLGRVDLSNMTCFSNKTPSRTEKDLLRQYLDKNHNFRHGRLQVPRRGLICDNFADKGRDPIAGSGWRNFSGFFGADQIVEVGWSNYFPSVASQGFLWTYGSGGGQFYTCTGVGSSDDFALQDPRAVFTMWLGSYFGDWDTESNFLRAPLGSSTYTLTSTYSGFPQWLYHPMAMGETIGYCARLTQNNIRRNGLYPPFNPGAGQVHIALLGDPTLRMHPVLPPSGLNAASTARGTQLRWTASPDVNLLGYHLYRAPSLAGPFIRISGDTPVRESSFNDKPPPGTHSYMVRAVKLERSSSGTYLNASQGIFVTASTNDAVTPSLEIAFPDQNTLQLRIFGAAGQPFAVETSADLANWELMTTNALSINGFNSLEPARRDAPQSFYRAKSLPDR